MLGDEDHQRVEVYGREIVGVIPELHLEFDNPTEDLTRLRFAMTDRLLVTMRRIPLRSVENVRRSIAAGTLYTAPIEITRRHHRSLRPCDRQARRTDR